MRRNQGRQALGWYCLSTARADVNRFFQHYLQYPLLYTITNMITPPGGMNAMVAYLIYGGHNQEDSVIVNQASADRGFFRGSFFRSVKAVAESGQQFRTPDPLTTRQRQGPNISKLVDGFVQPGTVVVRGDVLIGMVEQSKTRDSEYSYTDKSIQYNFREPAVVVAVWDPRRDDTRVAVVKLRSEREMTVGSKISSRSGNKAVESVALPQSDMPYTEDGTRPDLIINPHSMPTRMTVGQILETRMAMLASTLGVVTDGTFFKRINFEEISEQMVALGMRYHGKSRMYNGLTGEHFNEAVLIAPTFYQRLGKFVESDANAVGGGTAKDRITGQPLRGISKGGSIREGEMETSVFISQGATRLLSHKMSDDSDGMLMPLCRGCGKLAAYNASRDIEICRNCREMSDVVQVPSSRSAIAVHQEMDASGVDVRMWLNPIQLPVDCDKE